MNSAQAEEFRQFVSARSPALLRSAYLLTGDVHLAQDLLQTALLSVARHWSRIRRREQPEAYVRKALYRHQVDRWRSRARRPETLVPMLPETPHFSDHAAEWANRDGVLAVLRTLPQRQRAVIVLRFYEDRTESDIAELLGISIGAVRSHSARALAKLRDHYAAPAEMAGRLEGQR